VRIQKKHDRNSVILYVMGRGPGPRPMIVYRADHGQWNAMAVPCGGSQSTRSSRRSEYSGEGRRVDAGVRRIRDHILQP